jgi:prepilin-type processing-associated H-X9-DG protein
MVVVIAITAILLGLFLAAVQKARDVSLRLRCQNQMRQIGLALHQYHNSKSAFPSGVRHFVLQPGVGGIDTPDPEPFPLMTWHTRILPWIEQDALWRLAVRAYEEDRYFLSDPPHVAQSIPVALFLCPADGSRPVPQHLSDPAALTSYLGVEGVSHVNPSGMLYLDSETRFADVLDGTSQTLFVGERPPAGDGSRGRWYGGWGSWGTTDSYLGVRETNVFDWVDGCPDGPYTFHTDRLDNPCSVFHFWSLHIGGANFLFVDGSVRFLPYSAAPLLPALATRDGGEVCPLD